jgi:hypothetical protein
VALASGVGALFQGGSRRSEPKTRGFRGPEPPDSLRSISIGADFVFFEGC